MKKIKNPKAQERVLLTKYADRDPRDPWLICNFAYKAVYPNGSVSYVGSTPEGIVGYNGELEHCFRIESEEELEPYWEAKKLGY